MSNATHTAKDFGSGLSQHRVVVGSLVAVGLAAPGMAPARWTVSRVTSRGVRWTLPPMTSGEVRGLRRCDVRLLASVLRAVERGRF